MYRSMHPKNSKQLKIFLGIVNFYQDMFPKRSHFLAPFNKLASMKGKDWYWGAAEQKKFELAKEMLTKRATLAFPDFKKPLDLYTDVSHQQLGSTLLQDGKSLGFYTQKLKLWRIMENYQIWDDPQIILQGKSKNNESPKEHIEPYFYISERQT